MSWFGPVGLVARAALRERRGTIAAVVAVAVVVTGTALTAAAGARRTATVVDRMVAQVDMPDLAVGIALTPNGSDIERLRAAESALADLPGVERAIALVNIFVPGAPSDGSWYLDIGTGLDGRYLDSGWAGPLSVGRLPNGDGEVALEASTASRLGLRVGDELVAPTISADTMGALLAGQASERTPDGPQLRFRVVGIFRESVFDDPSSGFGLASPDTASYLGDVGTTSAYFAVGGDSDLDAEHAVATVSEVMADGVSYLADPDLELDPIRNTVEVTAAGLALFALLAAVAGLIALGQVVGRQVGDSRRLAAVTRPLGMRDGQMAAALALPSVTAAGVGIVVGAMAAGAFSPIFPTGLGRKAEPSPGIRIDWLVLVVGSLALFAAVSVLAMMVARQQVRTCASATPRALQRTRPGLRRWLPLPVSLGSGLVLVPNRTRSGVRPASALFGTFLGVAGVAAIVVFNASQRATVDDPARYGWAWDVDSEITMNDPEPFLAALANEPVLAAVGVASCGGSTIGDDDTVVCALKVLAGSMPLTYHAGRAPQSADEVAAGRATMASHDLAIGDRVEVTGANGATRTLEIVGVVVMPDTTAPGNGLVTTPEGLEALGDAQNLPILTLRFARGVEPQEIERVLATDYGLQSDSLTYASPPALVERLELVRPTLVALAVFLGTLGVIGLVHFLSLSNARRSHDTAVLEALGFVRAQTVAVVVWQALTIASIGVIVGTPLGVMIGRSAWILSVNQLGIIDAATIPLRSCAIVVAAALLGAGVVGLLTGRLAARRGRVAELRHE